LLPPASQNALLALYRAWDRIGLSAIRPAGTVVTLILIGVGASGCSLSQVDAFARVDDADVTGSIRPTPVNAVVPTDSDLAFARNAASDVLTKGDKDSSQPWENPQTGARGSVTPLAEAYSGEDGRVCRDFLASYVNGTTETWLQGAACKTGRGRWEIRSMTPWRKS